MKYYIKKGISRAIKLGKEMQGNSVGTTKEDFDSGKFIEISEVQADFYSEHPNATFQEISDMEMQETVIPEISQEERYKMRVEELMREKYTEGAEIRILFNGQSDPAWQKHEQDAADAKEQAKREIIEN